MRVSATGAALLSHQQAPPKGSGFVLASMHQRGWHELSTGCNMHALRSVRGIVDAAPHGRSLVLEGRDCTGSSKSSTLLTLFHNGGHILVDGVDISSLPLKKLRTGLSIIPQVGAWVWTSAQRVDKARRPFQGQRIRRHGYRS